VEYSIQIKRRRKSAKEEKQDRGDLLDGRVEITFEKTDQKKGNHEEPGDQGDQNISDDLFFPGGNHLFPQKSALHSIVPGDNFSGNRFAIQRSSLSFLFYRNPLSSSRINFD
jgi:hypothetical protein